MRISVMAHTSYQTWVVYGEGITAAKMQRWSLRAIPLVSYGVQFVAFLVAQTSLENTMHGTLEQRELQSL